jgi:hypothetical protein
MKRLVMFATLIAGIVLMTRLSLAQPTPVPDAGADAGATPNPESASSTAGKRAHTALGSSDPGTLERVVPFAIGDAWSDSRAWLYRNGNGNEEKVLPGMEIVAAQLEMQTPLGRAHSVAIETRDGYRIARITFRLDDDDVGPCAGYVSKLKKAARLGWSSWRTKSLMKGLIEIQAVWPGDQRLTAHCGPVMGANVELNDAWLDVPTRHSGFGGKKAAGEVVWDVVTRGVSAARAVRGEIGQRDVAWAESEIRTALQSASDKSLSTRARMALEAYRSIATRPVWIIAQFNIGMRTAP